MLKRHDYCHVKIPAEDSKILNYNQGEKPLKAPFTIYFDLECLLEKEQSCQNNPEKSCIKRKAKHEPSGCAMFTKCLFDKEKKKFDYYRGTDCIEKWCEKLRDCATVIINHKEKEIIPLTDKESKFYKEQKVYHICQKEFCYDKNKENKIKPYEKIRSFSLHWKI